jgi:hypothetical protein
MGGGVWSAPLVPIHSRRAASKQVQVQCGPQSDLNSHLRDQKSPESLRLTSDSIETAQAPLQIQDSAGPISSFSYRTSAAARCTQRGRTRVGGSPENRDRAGNRAQRGADGPRACRAAAAAPTRPRSRPRRPRSPHLQPPPELAAASRFRQTPQPGPAQATSPGDRRLRRRRGGVAGS